MKTNTQTMTKYSPDAVSRSVASYSNKELRWRLPAHQHNAGWCCMRVREQLGAKQAIQGPKILGSCLSGLLAVETVVDGLKEQDVCTVQVLNAGRNIG